jgi:hypothetical protein
VRFEKGYATGNNQAGAGSYTMQEYWIFDEADHPQRAALFTFGNRDPVTRQVQSGQRLHVGANTTYTQVAGVNNNGAGYSASTAARECRGEATFEPISGHSYTVIQAELAYASCELRIVDLSTGAPPPDVQINDQGTFRP